MTPEHTKQADKVLSQDSDRTMVESGTERGQHANRDKAMRQLYVALKLG